jgi:type I restriction enzyme S subunit
MTQITAIQNDWKEATLVDCLEAVIDYRGKTPKKSNHGILTLSAKSVKMGSIDYSQAYHISKETYDKFMVRGFPKKGDILMTTEAPLGCIAKLDRDDVAVAQRLLTLRGKRNILDNDYLMYYLTSKRGQHELQSRASGSTVQGIKRSEFEYVKIQLPTYKEQVAIASVLASLDRKIELLREQNKNLEEAASLLFHEWFIDYNFPDTNNKPYTENGGRMIESEVGDIPENWEVMKLDKLVELVNGYSYKGSELRDNGESALVTLKSFDRNGGFQVRGFKPFEGTPKENQEVKIGDLIVAHTDLTQNAEVLGNPAFIFDNDGFRKMYITMDLVKILSRKKELNNSFLYYLMKTRAFKRHCTGYSNGTTVLHLSKKAIPEFRLALPTDLALAEKFSKMASPITNKISKNNAHMQSLSTLRDITLPRLMTGELRVKNFN